MTGSRPQGFARNARLTRPRQFRRVFEQPVRVTDRAFTLLARPRSDTSALDEGARLGLAISKKCARLAVDRHRLKRLIRESFRQVRHELPAVDVVVMCRPAATTLTKQAARAALDKLWQRLIRQCADSSSA